MRPRTNRFLALLLALGACTCSREPIPAEICGDLHWRAPMDGVEALDIADASGSTLVLGCAMSSINATQAARPEVRKRLIGYFRTHPDHRKAFVAAMLARDGCVTLAREDQPPECLGLRELNYLADQQRPPRRLLPEWADELGIRIYEDSVGLVHPYDPETGVILNGQELKLRAYDTTGLPPHDFDLAYYRRIVARKRAPELEGRRAVLIVMRDEAGEPVDVGHRYADGVEVPVLEDGYPGRRPDAVDDTGATESTP